MKIAVLVLDFVRALVWPTVVMIVLIMFRYQLKELLGHLKSASLPGGVALSFAEGVREVSELSREVKERERTSEEKRGPNIPLTEANARMLNLGLRPSPSGLDFDYYRNMAMQDPNLALAGLRIELEILLRNMVIAYKLQVKEISATSKMLKVLFDAKIIDADQYELAANIFRLCNVAVHCNSVTYNEAIQIIDAASTLAYDYLMWLSWGFPDGWQPSDSAKKPTTGDKNA